MYIDIVDILSAVLNLAFFFFAEKRNLSASFKKLLDSKKKGLKKNAIILHIMITLDHYIFFGVGGSLHI